MTTEQIKTKLRELIPAKNKDTAYRVVWKCENDSDLIVEGRVHEAMIDKIKDYIVDDIDEEDLSEYKIYIEEPYKTIKTEDVISEKGNEPLNLDT